jgi:hypothetical protein
VAGIEVRPSPSAFLVGRTTWIYYGGGIAAVGLLLIVFGRQRRLEIAAAKSGRLFDAKFRSLTMANTSAAARENSPEVSAQRDGALVRLAIAFTAWAERWFPDAFIFVAIAVVVVSAGAMINGASPLVVSQAFGSGFWSLITFTMQMAFIVIGGYVVATSAPAQRLIRGIAELPKSGTGAVGLVAAVSMVASLLNWGFSLIVGGLLVRGDLGNGPVFVRGAASG